MYYTMSTATLNANSNVLELTHSEIDNTCSFEIYVDDSSDVIPQKLSVSGTTLSVIFDGKPSRNVECRVLIIKGTGYIDASKVAYERYLWEPWITNVKEAIDYFSEQGEITKIDLNTLSDEFNSRVPSQTVSGGVLYHSTTGNTWKKLDAQNLDYDEQSTIYSAMGNIDELETTATNLVGAINEVKNSASVPLTRGYPTAVNNIRAIGNSKWVRQGKICTVSLEDLQFQNSGNYNDYLTSPIFLSNLPKPKNTYNAFIVVSGDNRTQTYNCRFVLSVDGNKGVIKPHYTSITGGTTNFYGQFTYECVD